MCLVMKNFFRLILLIISILSITGCGAERQAAAPERVTIAVQTLPNDESISRAWYANELGKKLGVKVVVLNYDMSGLINNAMATGNIDIAIIGTPAAAIGISKNLPYKIFWIHNIEGENESLVVKNNSNINSITDLKDKRIAVPFGATTHYALLLAMQRQGLYPKDVKLFDMHPQEMLDAWRNEQLDAAFVWQPTLEELLSDGHVLINSRQLNEQGITTADVGVVNKIFAQKHPEIVNKYIELQNKAHELFKRDPTRAASIAANTLNISADDALRQMNELVWLNVNEQISDRYLGTSEKKGRFSQTLLDTAKFLEHNNVIERAANFDAFTNAIDPSFAESFVQ